MDNREDLGKEESDEKKCEENKDDLLDDLLEDKDKKDEVIKKRDQKVGLVSLGISLIVIGLLIFVALFTEIDTMKIFLPVWPMVLMVLTLEMFWYNIKETREEGKFATGKIITVIIVMIILIGFYIGFFLRNPTGRKIIRDITSSDYGFDRSDSEDIDGIECIVVQGDELSDINMDIRETNEVRYRESRGIRAVSKEEAKKRFEESTMSFNRIDDVLYINQRQIEDENKDQSKLDLTIPSDKKIEVVNGRDLFINISDLKNDVLIDGFKNVYLSMDESLDVQTSVYGKKTDDIEGNIEWKEKDSDNGSDLSQNRMKLGGGTNKLEILNVKEVLEILTR